MDEGEGRGCGSGHAANRWGKCGGEDKGLWDGGLEGPGQTGVQKGRGRILMGFEGQTKFNQRENVGLEKGMKK